MIQKEMKINNENGLEAREVAFFVQTASGFASDVRVQYEGKKVNAKSIMGMMSLGLARGELVTVITDGSDEESAITKIEEFLSGK